MSSIETPEQIVLHMPLAGVGSRCLAYIIDLALQIVPISAACIFALSVMAGHGAVIERDETTSAAALTLFGKALLSAVLFIMNFGYFAFFEVIWHGQSPGKRALGLRVVRDGGYPVDGRTALLRNFLRLIDYLPAAYLMGLVAIFAGRAGKRVGDYVAGTLVVREAAGQDKSRG